VEVRRIFDAEEYTMGDESFKTCPCCGKSWPTRQEFVAEESLQLNGYMADFEKLDYGLLFFTHEVDDCRSTMAVEVSTLKDLYQGPVYKERLTGTETCPGYCRDQGNLNRCEAKCECAYVRELMQVLQKMGNRDPQQEVKIT
jgi:hypothetical protein